MSTKNIVKCCAYVPTFLFIKSTAATDSKCFTFDLQKSLLKFPPEVSYQFIVERDY